MHCHLYKVLQYYDFKEAVGNISIRWEHAFKYPKYARKIRSVIRLLINVDRYGFSLCESCDNFVANTIEHVLFDCNANHVKREVLWNNVLELCPRALIIGLDNMSNKDLCVFILNGLNSKYIMEWGFLYSALVTFMYEMSQ